MAILLRICRSLIPFQQTKQYIRLCIRIVTHLYFFIDYLAFVYKRNKVLIYHTAFIVLYPQYPNLAAICIKDTQP